MKRNRKESKRKPSQISSVSITTRSRPPFFVQCLSDMYSFVFAFPIIYEVLPLGRNGISVCAALFRYGETISGWPAGDRNADPKTHDRLSDEEIVPAVQRICSRRRFVGGNPLRTGHFLNVSSLYTVRRQRGAGNFPDID